MIKAVMFDAGGVLHFSSDSQGEDIKNELGLTDEQISKFYSHYIPLLGKGVISEEQLWAAVKEDFGTRTVQPSERLMTRSWEQSLQKMPGMYELVEELKQKGLIVMLLSNVTPQFAEVLESKGHYDVFDLKVLSYEIGMWKPESGIYKLALDTAGIGPSEAIFIDDENKNIIAANNEGMTGLLFKNEADLRNQLSKYMSI